MNTDIRIDWRSGMEITPQTFIEMENNIFENRILLRKILAAKAYGIIPWTKFSIIHELHSDTLVLKQVTCDVLFPNGQLAVVDTRVPITLPIPGSQSKELYLVLEMGDHQTSFEKDGIPFVSNEYRFDLKELSAIRVAQPLLKLVKQNESWMVHDTYIPPVITCRSSTALLEKIDVLKKSVDKIIEHEHAALMEDRVYVMMLLDQLKTFSVDDSLRELMLLCRRVATALGYSVMQQKIELSLPYIMDAEPFLDAFLAFIDDIAIAMNDLKPEEVVKEPDPEPEPPKVEEWYPMI